MCQDFVMQLQFQNTLYGGIDLIKRDLPVHHCLVQAENHVLRIGQPAWAEQQVGARFYCQDGSLCKAVGVAYAAHPECIADNDSIEMQLVTQQFGYYIWR